MFPTKYLNVKELFNNCSISISDCSIRIKKKKNQKVSLAVLVFLTEHTPSKSIFQCTMELREDWINGLCFIYLFFLLWNLQVNIILFMFHVQPQHNENPQTSYLISPIFRLLSLLNEFYFLLLANMLNCGLCSCRHKLKFRFSTKIFQQD